MWHELNFITFVVLQEIVNISTATIAVPLATKKSNPTGIFLVLKSLHFFITWVQFVQNICVTIMTVLIAIRKSNAVGTKFELTFVCLFSDFSLIIKLELIRTVLYEK